MSVIRNLVLVVAAAVPIGAAIGPFFTTAPGGVVVVATTPTTTTTPTPTTTPTGTGTGSTTTTAGVVISNSQTNCTVPNNNNVVAAAAFTNDIQLFRSSSTINAPVQLDPNLSAIAAFDIADMAANNYLGTVSSTGQTLMQRVLAVAPGAKSAAEIIVKGCFGNNSDVDIINLIAANSSAAAIMANPNWNHFGISVQPDFSQGSPDRGIYWVIVFVQE